MSITIQSPEGRPLTTVSLDRGAKAAFSLMEHEYIELPFKLTEPVNIPVGSYVETAGHFDEATAALLRPRYYVCKPQSPTWNERTGAFEYRLRLDAPHYLWNNFIFRYTPENTGAEVSWTLTAPLDVQLGVFLRNLAALGFTHAGKPYTYVIHDTMENKAVAMTYDGTHLLDALYGMGDKEHWGCDVWVVDNAIHFGRCESGDPVRIELDAEARTMARSESKTDYATRLLVFGGTKNLPENYRAASPALTVNGVVQRRLMLPSGTPYVDVHPGRSVFGTVEQIVTFDDIYPRRTGTLSGVRTVDRTVKEGDKQTGTFKAYQYRDAGLTFKDDYVLKGQELRVVFQSGKLNGLHFAVQFNPEGKSPADQLWEIVANSDYGRLLPDETVRPADGDKYVLYGFDIRLVSDQYVPSAEQELKRRAEEYARRLAADDGTYTATLRGSWVGADPLRRTFAAGQRVRLVNPAFFPSDGRESRVIGWELNLDIPTDAPVYTFGESARYSRLADIEEKVDALVYKGTTYTGGGGSGVYVVRTNDTTPPSDSNVLSALRALATFIRKDRPDTMPHLLKLLDGLETGTFAAGRTGGRIDRAGNGELGSLTLRDLLTAVRLITGDVRSKNYTPGDMGTGFGLTTGEGGSRLEVDYLLVRRVATFLELLIREMRHVGGTLVLSGASGKVVRVEDKPSAWRVHFKTREDGTTVAHGFTVGAQARCQTYNRTSGNTYYWRLVTAVGDDWVELSKSDYDKAAPTGTTRTAPAVGDELVQLGHRTDASRQGAIVLESEGTGGPSIRLLTGIRSYSLTDANVRVLLSPSAVRVIADEVSFASGKTVEQTIKDSGEKAIEEAKKYFDTQKKGIDNSIGAVSGKVDNLVIGGRNLLKYARLISIPATYAYGRGSYTTAVDTATLCEGQRSLKVTASKVGSVGGTDNFVWEAWNVVRQSECVTVSFYAKAVTAGTRFSVRMGGDVCDFPQTVSLSTDWQRFEMTFREPGRKWMCIVAWFDRPGTVWIALPKMELGSRATDWSLAPEDVYNEAQLKANGVKAELNSSITDAKNTAQNVQTNLDNLTIGGRNLLRYSALEKTPLNNIVYGRKTENAPVGVEEGYQGAKAVKLVFTTPGKPSVSEVMWHTWEERTDHNRVEPVVLRFWAKADKGNTRMWTALGYHGGKIARPTISSEWKEYTVNFMPDGPWALWCIGLDAPGTVWISRPKLEYGTKPTDWTPAPEDVTSEIAAKTEAARQAAQAETIGLNKWIAQAYYTGKDNAATPPKLEDIAGKTPTRTVELKDAQFNVPGGSGSVFGMDYYTGIRTTYVYLDADYNLTTGIQHDDAGSLYVNGALVASGGIQASSWKSVTLPLKRGWNRIDGLWNEGGGGDYFKFQAPLENDAHIIQLACRPNVNIDPMRAVTMQSVEEQKAGFNTFNKQFTAWSKETETTLKQQTDGLATLTKRVTDAELKLDPKQIWLGIKNDVTNTVDDGKTTLVNELKSKTGIDIQQGVITLDAEKVKVQNGSQTAAMFENGKLKADLIDASRIDAGKLNASQIFSGTIDARNATFNNLTVSQGSKLGGWKVQGSDLVSDAATNASIRIEHRGKLLTSDESNPIEINNSAGNTLLIDGSRSSVQAEVTLTGKINNIRALSELSPAGLYTNLAAQEYKYGSLGAVVANVMYMPSSRTFRTAGVVGRIHDSAPNRNASYKKGFNGVFGENLRADGLMLGARDLTGDGTVYSIESLMTDTVLLIRGRPIIDLSNTPAELKGKFFFIFTHTGTRVRFKKDGRITQDNNAWNIFLLFNGSTWEVRSWDCDYREF